MATLNALLLRTARAALLIGSVAGLLACGALQGQPDAAAPASAAANVRLEAFNHTWIEHRLPTKRPTEYSLVQRDGREAIAARAESSVSVMRRDLRVEPAQLGRLKLSWLVEDLSADADVAQRDLDDSPARLVLAFDGDRGRFSPRDAAVSELAMLVTGEPLPYATLMYVWCAQRPPGSVIENARTSRIRKLVIESGPGGLGRWIDYERDLVADFERVFGEPPGALVGMGLMTDADNTRSRARTWYGAPQLLSRDVAAPR